MKISPVEQAIIKALIDNGHGVPTVIIDCDSSEITPQEQADSQTLVEWVITFHVEGISEKYGLKYTATVSVHYAGSYSPADKPPLEKYLITEIQTNIKLEEDFTTTRF